MTEHAQQGRTERVHASAVDAAPSAFSIAGHPVHPMLIPFPIAFLVGALLTDVGFLATGDAFFARMSSWLLVAGLATGALAGIPGAVDFFTTARARRSRAGKIHAIGNVVVLAFALGNVAVRLLTDMEAAVVPWGLGLSALTAVLLGVTGWYGGELSYRQMVGVDPRPELTADRRTTAE
jgi:uncharacterized membrane protein